MSERYADWEQQKDMGYDLSKITYGGRCEKHLRFRPCEVCARDAALRHQTVEVRPLDEAAVRRIVREELARSSQAAPGGPAEALGPDEQATVKDSLTAEQNQGGAQGKGES